MVKILISPNMNWVQEITFQIIEWNVVYIIVLFGGERHSNFAIYRPME